MSKNRKVQTSLIPINDLSRGIAISDESAEAVMRVLKSGQWINGLENRLFEIELSNFLNVAHVLGVASGTDALEIALRAVGCTQGSRVITVANAGGYASVAGGSIGCELVYCDIDEDTQLISPSSLEPLLSLEIDAVVVTHLYGNIAPIIQIMEMCGTYGIPVIEDCAQAIGGVAEGRYVGTIGDIGILSFYPTKNLGGIGDGGAVITNSAFLANIVRQLGQYGWSEKYRIQIPGGMNSRLDEIQAAILRIGLSNLLSSNKKRREILKKYSHPLLNSSIKLVTSFSDQSAAHLAVLLLPSSTDRDNFRLFLNESGVQTEVHYPILDYEQIGLQKKDRVISLPVSENTSKRIVSIPLFPQLTSDEVDKIVELLRNYPAT